MGNTQSAEAPRRPPTKLTKPRTNTSTTNLLGTASTASRRTSKLDLPGASNKQSSTISIEAVLAVDDAARKGKPGNHSKRRGLFRSNSAQAKFMNRAEEHISSIADDANQSSPLGSLQVEMPVDIPADSRYDINNIRPPMRNSRSAPMHHPRSHSTLRLSLVVEAQSSESESGEGTKQLGAKTGGSEEKAPDSIIAPPEQSNSLQSMPIPIRRRSLLTPGIATRASSKDDPYRKALPPQPVSPVSAMTDDTSSEKMGKRFSFRRSLPAQSVPSSPIMDDNSSGKLGKRCSFRMSLSGQSTPSIDKLQEYYCDQSKPTSSSLEQLAALEPPKMMDPHPRTATPNDLDYGHIGAFKLGSLRITNGAASPAPSGKIRHFDTVSSVRDGHRVHCSLQPEIEPGFPRDSEEHHDAMFMDEIQSPENHRLPDEAPRMVETMVEIPASSLDLPDFEPSGSMRGDTNLQSPTRAYEIAQEYMQEIASSPFSFEESSPPTPRLEPTSKHTAMEDNLFDDEPDTSASSTVSASVSYPNSLRAQNLNEALTSNDMLVVPKLWKNDSQRGRIRAVQARREPPAKPLEKSDSGYSSKTSLRSTKSHNSLNQVESASNASNAPALPDKDPPATPPKNQHTKLSVEASVAANIALGVKSGTEYAPAPPTKDYLSSSSIGIVRNPGITVPTVPTGYADDFSKKELPPPPARQAPPVPLKQDHTVENVRRERPPLPIKSIEETRAAALARLESSDTFQQPTKIRRQSTPVAVTKPARPPLKTSGSDTAISSNRRLQKYRPTRPASLIVQGYREIEPDRIPPISQDVEEHLDERLKNFPLLTHTYKTVHRTNSKETLATVFSITSDEQRLSRFDGQSPISPNNDHIEDFSLSDSDTTKPTNMERFSNVRKMFRRSTDVVRGRRQSVDTKARNRSSSRGDHEISLQDLAAASRHLGGSPYDHASKALDSRSGKGPRGPSPSNRMHQRSRSRPKIIGMDSESAAQFARDRSRLREELRQQNLQYGWHYDKPASHFRGHRNSFDDRSEFLGHIPVATMADRTAPPVPPLSHETVTDPAGVVAAAQSFPYVAASMSKKTESPPPVSMKIKRKQVAQPQPVRGAAAASGLMTQSLDSVPVEAVGPYNTFDEQRKKQAGLIRDGQRFARNSLELNFVARQSFNMSGSRSNRPSFEQQQQQSSRSFHARHSFEQQGYYASQPVQQPHTYLFQVPIMVQRVEV